VENFIKVDNCHQAYSLRVMLLKVNNCHQVDSLFLNDKCLIYIYMAEGKESMVDEMVYA